MPTQPHAGGTSNSGGTPFIIATADLTVLYLSHCPNPRAPTCSKLNPMGKYKPGTITSVRLLRTSADHNDRKWAELQLCEVQCTGVFACLDPRTDCMKCWCPAFVP